MRAIDAYALAVQIRDNVFRDFTDEFWGVMQCIREAPIIESERKTGKWSMEFSPAYMGGAYCECSQCNYKFAVGAYFEPDEWDYCPNCGAKMEGEKKND